MRFHPTKSDLIEKDKSGWLVFFMAPPVGLEPTTRPLCVPLWLPTAHCAVGLTRRALCALLAKQMAFGCGAAQARCFEPHLQNKKEIPDIRHLFVGSPSWTRTNDPAVNSRMLYRLSYRGILNCATLLALLKYISTIRKFCQRFFWKNTKHFSKKLHVGFGTAFCRCLRDFSFTDDVFVYNSLDRRH